MARRKRRKRPVLSKAPAADPLNPAGVQHPHNDQSPGGGGGGGVDVAQIVAPVAQSVGAAAGVGARGGTRQQAQAAGAQAYYDATVAGPSVSESSTVRRAARQQSRLIQKYALNHERDRLADKHYEYDSKGQITKRNATNEQIHNDLVQARTNVKRTSTRLFNSPAVRKANTAGEVLGPKQIKRIDQNQRAKRQEHSERVQNYIDLGYSPQRARETVHYEEQARRPDTKLGQAVRKAKQSGGSLPMGSPRLGEDILGPLPQGIKTASDLAIIAALPVPYIKGAKILEALRAAKPGEALLSRAVKSAAERALPTAATKAAGAGIRGVSKVPFFKGTEAGLVEKPLRTIAGTAGKGGLAVGTAMHPGQAADIGSDIADWATQFNEYGQRASDVGEFVKAIPPAFLKTAEELATSGEARRQTLFGARDLALGATAFPFVAGYEALTEGPGAALDTFGSSIKHDFKSSIGPAIRGDWETFQNRMEREGLGGAAIPLSFLIPATSILSRTGLKATELAPPLNRALKYRKPLKYGPGQGEVYDYDPNRGLVGALASSGLDLTRALAQRRRVSKREGVGVGKKTSKGDLFPGKDEQAPLLPNAGINKYRRGRHAVGLATREDMAGAYRGEKYLRGRGQSLQQISKRQAKNHELFSYALELGVPKDAASMVRMLKAKVADIRREVEGGSRIRGAGAEIKGLETLIDRLERKPGLINDAFKADAARARDIVDYFQKEAEFLNPTQTELRAYAEQAEQLAKRKGSELPPLEDVLGPDATWANDARRYVQQVGVETIDAEAGRVGLGKPTYFPAYESQRRPIAVTKSQSTQRMVPKASRGELARAGARDMNTFRLLETMERLNRTINEVKAGRAAADQLARDPAEILSTLEGRKIDPKEISNLTAQELTERLANAGLNLDHVQLFNAKALDKKFKIRRGEQENAPAESRLSEGQLDKQMNALFDDPEVVIKATDVGKTATPKGKGWMVIGDTELHQFRGRFRPYGHLGESAKIPQVWARAKTLASRYVLAHPSWFAFQAYANAYLMGIAEPGSLASAGYKRWLNSMTDAQRQNVERAIGIPAHHPDLGTGGSSLIAGWTGLTKYKQSDWYQRHLAGRNPLDALFYGPERRMEHSMKGRVLYTKARREAWKNMGSSMNKIMSIMDEVTGGDRKGNYKQEMDALLNDPKRMEKLAQETNSFMGDYATFNQAERHMLANNILFYGFIRHSLMLSLYTLPVKHPLRTALLSRMGAMVNDEQKKTITAATKDWLREYMRHLGYPTERIREFVSHFKLDNNSIPMSVLGSFVLGDGTVIDLKRASFAGSLPVEAQAPWQVLGGFNPIAQFMFESITGMDTYTGQPIQTSENYHYVPGLAREDPFTPEADTVLGSFADAAKFAGVSALQYLAPLRQLSDSVAELPPSERTSLSFPLPGINPLPEVPYLRKTAETQGRRAIRKQIQYETKHGWRSFEPEIFPFMPHESAAIPSIAMAWLYKISKRSEAKNAAEAKAEDKKKPESEKTGYGAINLQGYGDKGYGGIDLQGYADPSRKTKQEKADEVTTYAESVYKTLANVFDVKPSKDPSKPPRFDETSTGLDKASAAVARLPKPKKPEGYGAINLPTKAEPEKGGPRGGSGTRAKTSVPTGPLTEGQQTFGAELAKRTGLSAHVIGAWMLAEQSSTAAQGYEDRNYNNWLNIGPNEQGPQFADPVSAAKRTADLINTSDYYAGIRASTQGSDQEQMRAIENSPWSATGYGAGGTLNGTYDLTGQTGQTVKTKPPPKRVVTRFEAIRDEAKKISSAQLPYLLGGGHVSGKIPGPRRVGTGYDCSGFVSRVLQKAGVKLPGALVSGDLATTPLLKDGPGAVTIFANPEHTFMRIGDKYYGTSHSNPGGGAGLIEGGYDQSYLNQFTVRHVPGLGKDIARRMGVTITPGTGGGTSAPGMTFSSDGTTASINSGAGTTLDAPGESDRPIQSEKVRSAAGFSQNQLLKAIGSPGGFDKLFGVASDGGTGQAQTDPEALLAALEQIAQTRKQLLRR